MVMACMAWPNRRASNRGAARAAAPLWISQERLWLCRGKNRKSEKTPNSEIGPGGSESFSIPFGTTRPDFRVGVWSGTYQIAYTDPLEYILDIATFEKFSHICVCYFQVKTNMGNFSEVSRSNILKYHTKFIILKSRKFSLDGPVWDRAQGGLFHYYTLYINTDYSQ